MPPVDPHTPLADVVFCVLDLETTGTSDEVDEIVEVGAVLVRGGERLGTFQTLVGHPLAPMSNELPSLTAVLASLLEFVRGAVIVGHNIRFDLRFLNAALWKTGNDLQFDPRAAVDTMPLARRLLGDDADDCRLGTLAERFDFATRPTHRALADAEATVELLHLVIERATHYGAFDLDDLIRLPGLMRHPLRAKLAATSAVPRSAGAACVLDRYGAVIHVVVADDLRHGLRRLFDNDDRGARPVVSSVHRHMHRIVSLECPDIIVSQLVALRWRSAMAVPKPPAVAFLQYVARSGRIRVVSDGSLPDVIAGPMLRAHARQAASLLASQPDSAAAFVDALRVPASNDSTSTVGFPLLDDIVERQRRMATAQQRIDSIDIDDASVVVHQGRVIDIVVNGRSWAPQLPERAHDDRATADEALFVADLIAGRQPGCEIRDSWSPQYLSRSTRL